MARSYSGDIQGWFASDQSSYEAEFFGCKAKTPDYSVEFYFGGEHLPKLEEGIKQCESALGEYKEKIESVFVARDRSLAQRFGVEASHADDVRAYHSRLQHVWPATDKLKEGVDRLFQEEDGDLAEVLGIPKATVEDLLVWYWRLRLGRKIMECVKGTGSCFFEAMLKNRRT